MGSEPDVRSEDLGGPTCVGGGEDRREVEDTQKAKPPRNALAPEKRLQGSFNLPSQMQVVTGNILKVDSNDCQESEWATPYATARVV